MIDNEKITECEAVTTGSHSVECHDAIFYLKLNGNATGIFKSGVISCAGTKYVVLLRCSQVSPSVFNNNSGWLENIIVRFLKIRLHT